MGRRCLSAYRYFPDGTIQSISNMISRVRNIATDSLALKCCPPPGTGHSDAALMPEPMDRTAVDPRNAKLARCEEDA